jgi:hypothetical protein
MTICDKHNQIYEILIELKKQIVNDIQLILINDAIELVINAKKDGIKMDDKLNNYFKKKLELDMNIIRKNNPELP